MITILACGDVGVKRADPHSIFSGCARTLRRADLCLAQLETTVSERGSPVPNARLAMRAPPPMLAAARAAGIRVMSFAGNHCLDFGYAAFEDTLDHAASADIAICGAGPTLESARSAAIVDCSGVRVAVLAVNSILPEGYAAESARPGCAPLRAHTIYEAIEHDQPGTPPRIRSFAHRGDLEALLAGIAAARRDADVVLLSIHWGIHMVRATLADYQTEVAHAAIDAGADAVLGHHPHLLKGVEFYRARPVFYSLGNFAIEQPHVWDPAITQSTSFQNLVSLNPTWRMDQVYMLPPVTRLTGVAKLIRHGDGTWETRFLPAWIDDDSAPRMLPAADPRFAEVAALLVDSSRAARLNSEVAVQGDELRLTPAAMESPGRPGQPRDSA